MIMIGSGRGTWGWGLLLSNATTTRMTTMATAVSLRQAARLAKTLGLRPRSHRTRRCSQMLHAKNGTHCCLLECSHSIANNCKQHQKICAQICLGVLCELGLTRAPYLWSIPVTITYRCNLLSFSAVLSWQGAEGETGSGL